MISGLALALVAAAPLKVAVMELSGGEGVSDKVAQSVTDAFTAELRHNGTLQILTGTELAAVLSVDRQKALAGCQTDSCMAEVAGALDVDRLVLGSVSKLGQSWLIHLQLVDARKAMTVGTADRRKKGGSIDDVLDALPDLARELFRGPAAVAVAPTPAPEPAPVPPAAPPSPEPAPPPTVTSTATPYGQVDRSKLKLIEDNAGHVIAFVPFGGLSEPFFFGAGATLYAQRVFGGGSEGDKRFDLVFWEPRARVPAEASFDFQDGEYSVTCGKKKIRYAPVPERRAKALLREARLMSARWDRHAYALARDEEGNYYYVDQAREPEDNKDFHVYLGSEGQMRASSTRVIASDSQGDVFGTPSGRLRLNRRDKKAEWITSVGKIELQLLEVQDNARLIYGRLGAYAHLPLGTPCDGVL